MTMCTRVTTMATLALLAACGRSDSTKPATGAPVAAAAPALDAAAPVPVPDATAPCAREADVRPPGCEADAELSAGVPLDLDQDGQRDLVVRCTGKADRLFVQRPGGCFTSVGELDGFWTVLDRPAVNGFRVLEQMIQDPSTDNRDESETVWLVYDPARGRYRDAAPGELEAPSATGAAPAPVMFLPGKVRALEGIAGVAVGEPGFKGPQPTCCLDCDEMVPPLKRLEALAATLNGPVAPAALRAVADHLRATAWRDLVPTTGDERAQRAMVTALDGLAGALETAATSLEAGDGTSDARAAAIEQAVTRLMAAARKLGASSTSYCGGD